MIILRKIDDLCDEGAEVWKTIGIFAMLIIVGIVFSPIWIPGYIIFFITGVIKRFYIRCFYKEGLIA